MRERERERERDKKEREKEKRKRERERENCFKILLVLRLKERKLFIILRAYMPPVCASSLGQREKLIMFEVKRGWRLLRNLLLRLMR